MLQYIVQMNLLLSEIENGSLFVSLMGITSAVGKVSFGALCTFCKVSPFKVFIVAQVFLAYRIVISSSHGRRQRGQRGVVTSPGFLYMVQI